jgi:hypothetical protein
MFVKTWLINGPYRYGPRTEARKILAILTDHLADQATWTSYDVPNVPKVPDRKTPPIRRRPAVANVIGASGGEARRIWGEAAAGIDRK